jgi:hypothetical protein
MARMIPEHFDESTTSIAERVLYYKLQDELDADWTVIHSLPYVDGSRTRLRQGECDFVLLHPRRGMLVLEAKSGTPSYADAEWEAVRKTLHRLVNEQGIAPADIAILGGHRLDKSSFARRRKLGNLSVREAGEPDAPNTIRYETVHRFKGLEADCILLTGIGQPSDYYREEHWRRFEYIGGSRARVVLHVFRRPGAGA